MVPPLVYDKFPGAVVLVEPRFVDERRDEHAGVALPSGDLFNFIVRHPLEDALREVIGGVEPQPEQAREPVISDESNEAARLPLAGDPGVYADVNCGHILGGPHWKNNASRPRCRRAGFHRGWAGGPPGTARQRGNGI